MPTAARAHSLERGVSVGDPAAPLYGSLLLPAGQDRADAVLILPGSGPVDRDGNFPRGSNNSLMLLAHGLAAQGIATLRIDKRGIGASRRAAPAEETLRFDTYVTDAVLWLTKLREEPRVARIFILGHSEGGLVGTLAAQRWPPAGLILVAGAGMRAGDMLRRQLGVPFLPPDLSEAALRILAALERGEDVADPPSQLAALFRPSVQPYLRSWLPLDPVAELAKLATPVLVIQGTADIQVTVADARRLAAARPGIHLTLLAGINHVLKQAPQARPENFATYNEPERPLHPELVPAIAAFLRGD